MELIRITDKPGELRWGSLEMNRVLLESFQNVEILDYSEITLPLAHNSVTIKIFRFLK